MGLNEEMAERTVLPRDWRDRRHDELVERVERLEGDRMSVDDRTLERLEAIAAQARRVIESIEGAKPAGGVVLWVQLWELRSLLLDADSLDLPRPGGVA